MRTIHLRVPCLGNVCDDKMFVFVIFSSRFVFFLSLLGTMKNSPMFDDFNEPSRDYAGASVLLKGAKRGSGC